MPTLSLKIVIKIEETKIKSQRVAKKTIQNGGLVTFINFFFYLYLFFTKQSDDFYTFLKYITGK